MAHTLWRVFPWDPGADPGEPFSPEFLPRPSGQGRFDLPEGYPSSVCYLAETPDHAIAEKIQDLRNRVFVDEYLFELGRRLAISPVELDAEHAVADLCSPEELHRRGIAPDRLASRDRSVTQSIAAALHDDASLAGFRWWSAFSGDWHTFVLFRDRLAPDALSFGEPTPLDASVPTLRTAAHALGIEVREG